MNKDGIIKTITDLIDTPEHSELRWSVEKEGLDLIDKLETEQLTLGVVVKSLRQERPKTTSTLTNEDKKETCFWCGNIK